MKEKLFVIDADYAIMQNKPVIRLYCRDKNLKSVTVFDDSFAPYFYIIPKNNPEKYKKNLEKLSFYDNEELIEIKSVKIEKILLNMKKIDVLKVFAFHPSHIPKIKDVVKTWKETEGKREFDILFVKRYLVDKGIKPLKWIEVSGKETRTDLRTEKSIKSSHIKSLDIKKELKLKILAFDLETFVESGEQKIIMASIQTNTGFKKVLTYKKDNFKHSVCLSSEKEVIEKLIETINRQDPDIVVGYNSDGFDFPVLKERAEKNKVDLVIGRDKEKVKFHRKARASAATIHGRLHVDIFSFISYIVRPTLQAETMSLDNVANELLGIKKRDMNWKEIEKCWTEGKNLDKLADYCLHDSYLTLKLAEQLLPNVFALSKLTNQTPFETSRMTYGQLVEAYLIKKSAKKILVPNRPTREKIEERRRIAQYEGAFVKEPIPGLHRNLAVFDFRSLYPSIIISHNIDPYTFNCSCCRKHKIPDMDYHFCKKKKGFIPGVLGELIKQRAEIKKRMKTLKKGSMEYTDFYAQQYALKTVLNASYGYMGFSGSRWYCRECAESITALGRHYIHEVIETAGKDGFVVIYSDTDSIFLKSEGDIEKQSKSFLKKINKTLPGVMELEFEGIYKRGLFVSRKTGEKGAKKRYALIDSDGNITIRGFEKVRRDWSALAKTTQEKVLKLVLSDRKDDAVKLVQRTVKDLKNEKIDIKELTIHTQITRPIESYQQVGPHVAAAKKAAKKGEIIKPGMIITYIVTKGKGSISNRAELPEFAKNYDPGYYINNQLIPAALRVLRVFGVEEDELLMKGKQTGLGRFVKTNQTLS